MCLEIFVLKISLVEQAVITERLNFVFDLRPIVVCCKILKELQVLTMQLKDSCQG